MLSNPMLDVAIGLVLLYLLLSIIVTVLQEFLSSWLRLRNANLVTAIGELVGKGVEDKEKFFKHPLLSPLFHGDIDPASGIPKFPPAYVPRRNFALAVLDLQSRRAVSPAVAPRPTEATHLTTAPQGGASREPVEDLIAADQTERMPISTQDLSTRRDTRSTSEQNLAPAYELAAFFQDARSGVGLSSRIKKFEASAAVLAREIADEDIRNVATGALMAAVREIKTATDVVDTAVKELENLFDSTMDRAAGWYKVNAQWIALAIGVLLALTLNVDTIYIARQLSANDVLRARAVAAADAYYTSTGGQAELAKICTSEMATTKLPATTTAVTDNANAVKVAGATATTASTPPSPDAVLTDWEKVKDCVVHQINNATAELAAVGYPIGWTGWQGGWPWPIQDGRPIGQPSQNLGWTIVGILITGLALSLGASFWFDLLGKFMNVRMTGKREPTALSSLPTLPQGTQELNR